MEGTESQGDIASGGLAGYPPQDCEGDDTGAPVQTEPQKVGWFESAPGVKSSGRLNNFLAILGGWFLLVAGVTTTILVVFVIKPETYPSFLGTFVTLALTLGVGLIGGGTANKSLQERIKNGHAG